jgi:hypothetical protein
MLLFNQMQETEITEEDLKNVLNVMVKSFDDDLYALKEEELESRWFWSWNEKYSVEYNTYEFFYLLKSYGSSCKRWEEKHNGYICVVERVRDKYLMPKIDEFLKILKEKQ